MKLPSETVLEQVAQLVKLKENDTKNLLQQFIHQVPSPGTQLFNGVILKFHWVSSNKQLLFQHYEWIINLSC